MIAPAWFSQPYPPEGASAAEGIRNQLGKPELDHLTILVRESAQNSWDARISDDRTVDYRIDLRTISAADAPAWREQFLRGVPAEDHLPLRKALTQPTIRVMSISDRGTRGLGGPTRADVISSTRRDFVTFMRNIGEPRDRALGGGTYGFGKGILYLVSRPGVILVHTRCQVDGGFETRLMGAALWKSYDFTRLADNRRYTGRHWWGDTTGDVVEPLTGAAAESMARALGLQAFGASETGTTILVIDPNLEEREPARAAGYLADTIAWHLWPKMLENRSGVLPMRFAVTCDGISYPVPDPAETRPLSLFVAAYRKLAEVESRELYCGKPKKLLGKMALEKRVVPKFEPSDVAEMVGVSGLTHHVCLMRPAELVVNYWRGPKPPSELVSYAGVFRADDAMDEIYAAAEPPTHDGWNHQSLEHPDSTYVRTTFKRFGEAIEGLLDLRGGVGVGAAQVSLGAASSKLSPLIGGAWGIGAATDYGRPGDVQAPTPRPRPGPAPRGRDDDSGSPEAEVGSTPAGPGGYDGKGSGNATDGSQPSAPRFRRPKVEYVGDPYLDEYSGAAVLIQPFRLPVQIVQRVKAEVAVALTTDGGRETDPPAGAEMPGLVGWEDDSGVLIASPTFVIAGGDGRIWKAVVKPAADTVTDISLGVEAVKG
ncbi:hypothetical protein NONI108955_43570 [Nocardia ninae]|uniref:Uncharacterized protein n=1 Tax=Nocardia ninae NBRC 108245 TaxID=1210091 RepID=A0A511M8T8_9NOCA|nr:hypothetical protein [Nocardia ninae]GEM37009.1 hypothetical protein NN4_15280 [Nocardia ninae NBRC 108245]